MKENKDINIVIDESMIKNIQEFEGVKEEITCEICYGIVIKPKMCESCETVFCEKCINNWKKKDNSCPKRCSNFKIKDAHRIIKSLLDKLKIICSLCHDEFNYETFLKHFPECNKDNSLVKCPFCPNCKIKISLIEEYNKLLKENEILKNKIKIYEKEKEKEKEIEKEKENDNKKNEIKKNKNSYKWKKNQMKNNFQLSNDNKTIIINYSGCWNTYLLDYDFVDEKEYYIDISFDTFGIILNHMYIGFMNENSKILTGSCICSYFDNNFYIRIDNQTINEGKNFFNVQLESLTNLKIRFILDLKNKTLEIKNYDNNNKYGILPVYGKKFNFFVQKCNMGTIKYSLLSKN